MTYYRRRPNYNRARFTTEYAPKTDGFASADQRKTVLGLVEQIGSANLPSEVEARLTPRMDALVGLSELMSDNVDDNGEPVWRSVPTPTASAIIKTLIAVVDEVRPWLPTVDLRVVPTGRYTLPSGTEVQIDNVTTGKWAGWVFVKHPSGEKIGNQRPGQEYSAAMLADLTAFVQQYGAVAEQAREAARTALAERAAREAAEAARLVAEVATYEAHARSVFTVVGTKIATGNAVRFAVPGDDGALRFYILKAVGHRFTMRQVIGGRAPMPVAPERQRQVLADLCFTGPDGIRRAVVRYGQELGSCGICGRTLTDEESRRTGIGPVCAGRW